VQQQNVRRSLRGPYTLCTRVVRLEEIELELWLAVDGVAFLSSGL
jgi:hypothetical protein